MSPRLPAEIIAYIILYLAAEGSSDDGGGGDGLSQRLVDFSVVADVGPEVLWPFGRGRVTQDDDPLWPRMRRYVIIQGAILPSGQWRWQPPDSDDDDDDELDWGSSVMDARLVVPCDETEHAFRKKVDPDAANSLLLAAVRAACRMPTLSTMSYSLDRPAAAGWLEVDYSVGGGTARSGGGGMAELDVDAHPLFQPDEEVVWIWREAAEEHTGSQSGLVVVVKDRSLL
ncbi:hypothetical protein C8A05DRAFT_39034 [Staphylotrichum tortipilum]|uniref:Uncharacterized protein n=1 Tax=Staphylotrichum tortipilum TaxID=2831512 RepID=A0AAN6MAZ4_9PEZI|nr:hypothetical protein C8A05DRAFT_39034 [Staphylotrichum longicolle]